MAVLVVVVLVEAVAVAVLWRRVRELERELSAGGVARLVSECLGNQLAKSIEESGDDLS